MPQRDNSHQNTSQTRPSVSFPPPNPYAGSEGEFEVQVAVRKRRIDGLGKGEKTKIAISDPELKPLEMDVQIGWLK